MSKECFYCGISEAESKLFEVIIKEGVVKMCKKCASEENIPLIKKMPENSYFSYNKLNKKESVYERLSRMSGVNSKDKRPKAKELKKQETTLKEIIDKNYQKNISDEAKPDFLIKNFHWIIMRKRRSKHITQEQLAKEINEPEVAIKMIEKGVIPRGIYNLIEKLEKYFDTRLTELPKKAEDKPKKIGFDSLSTRELTIGDLRSMQKEEYEGPFEEGDDDLIFENKEDYPINQ